MGKFAPRPLAFDDFSEADHPRDHGKFASSSSGADNPPPSSLKGLTKIGKQLGSNPGGQYENSKGEKFYVKHSKSDEHAANEILATHLYEAAGAPIVKAHPIDLGDGKKGTISAWQKHEGKFDPSSRAHVKEAHEHFGTHAWLSNWDAIGLENDNQVPINGKLHTIDAGGALKFRAQGQPKSEAQFGNKVGEIESLRDSNMNPQSAKVFKQMGALAMHASTKGVEAVTPEKIKSLVNKHGHGNQADKDKMADKLIKRREHLLESLEL